MSKFPLRLIRCPGAGYKDSCPPGRKRPLSDCLDKAAQGADLSVGKMTFDRLVKVAARRAAIWKLRLGDLDNGPLCHILQ
jgi:hypothetical protein